jgi:hypothetical protein
MGDVAIFSAACLAPAVPGWLAGGRHPSGDGAREGLASAGPVAHPLPGGTPEDGTACCV